MVDYDPPPQLAPVEAQVGTAPMANLQGADNSDGTAFGKAFTQMMNLGKNSSNTPNGSMTIQYQNDSPAPFITHVG